MTTLDIKEAKFERIEPCASIAFLGKRRTGKTTWAKWVIQFIADKCDRFVVMCGNRDNISEWKRIIPALNVHGKDVSFLEALRDYQDKKCAPYSLEKLPIPRKYTITLVFDDCGSDTQFMHSKIMKDLLANGRHYGMYLIILAQDLMQMHKQNRNNLDYLGVLFTNNLKSIKSIYDEYGSVTDSRTFSYILKALTLKRGLCWIDNTANSTDVTENIFYKHMPWPHKVEPVGGEHVRQYSKRHLRPKDLSTKIKNVKQEYKPTTINVDTDGEEEDEGDTNGSFFLSEDIMAGPTMFRGPQGCVVIRKTKEKTE